MLANFFRIDGQPPDIHEPELKAGVQNGTLEHALYKPDEWPQDLKFAENVTFRQISFTRTKFSNVTFKLCTFVDCLFIGADFSEVNFQRCRFIDCNLHKFSISDTYLDPKTISLDPSYRKTHANIGVYVYQRLLDNSAGQKQPFFEMFADIEFRRWKRWQLKYDRASGAISTRRYRFERVRSLLYEVICGFGYRPLRFAVWTVILFSLFSLFNYHFLGQSHVVDAAGRKMESVTDSIYYSFSMLTALGFSTVTPVTDFAKVWAVSQAMIGIGWLGIFTSVLVKRLIK